MSLETLRERLGQQLAPVDGWSHELPARRSDFDLNPDLTRPTRELRPAAVLIAVIARPEGATVLMTRRADTLTSHTGQIAFPGGRLDAGETAMEAALREAREEVALASEAVEVLGLGDPYESGSGFLITPVIGWLAQPPVTTPSPDEVAEVFEAPWEFLMDVANHRRDFLEPEPGLRRWFWAMPWQDRYIWGVTAGILRALRDRLYDDETSRGAAVAEDAA